MFKRILIANRGEIALRVIRTAREMGMECVAVYSDLDAQALHARMAHRAVALGGSTPAETYLNVDKILAAAKETGAEAIHPGYGFLSENADFARAVTEAGLAWIGPPPEAIEVMGDKIESRRAMQAAGVPCVPGLTDPVDDPVAAIEAAEAIGYPVAIKAAAGGGGKGIRIVRERDEMESAFRAASGEAESSFGDGRLYLERYLDSPRHIEIQVLFDAGGQGVSLFERECSIQRRHQKLIEESPSVVVDAEQRAAMGEIALRAGAYVNYRGAGTVEFLWSGGEFYFLEMNTRLQVEHPVTEMVTGVDLVAEQLRIAAGEPLGFDPAELRLTGHAIEVRINAEDPYSGFLPSTGTLHNLRAPGGPWVRLDGAMYRGLEVGLSYDPMLGKLIVWGADRDQAIRRMRRAIAEMNVGGVRTSLPAILQVLETSEFGAGEFDTHFLESLQLAPPPEFETLVAAASAIFRHTQSRRRALAPQHASRTAWRDRGRRSVSSFSRRASEKGDQA
ncbi:MAG: acetyl-CoA carboxylase biotin carboxylase subunit [Planctomycetota bacterium]|jgi:acetyl-CoA carboxylase biotin carboxylase subunit|nr:acetyl-CoA carboxylase biotin carboxylase subunit [Planctomycetota bacterium]MDP6937797.1 acetyl-CoA carboxylase biotin carboxylase subunit [Planctomycetota bacterium]